MIKAEQYARKPFLVDAIQVTAENMTEVGEWCSGSIRTDGPNKYIKVRVIRALTERQTQAFIGDWVLYAGTSYKVYKDLAFKTAFDLYEG